MNSHQAKLIPVETILNSLGFHPVRQASNDLWFTSPFSNTEKTPSFHVNTQKNFWYCFSSGFGGNTLDLIIKLQKCTISEGLAFLENFDSFSFQKQITAVSQIKKTERETQIVKIVPIEHIALKQYLTGRCLTKPFIHFQIKEVHYEVNQKKYFAIGFKNRSDGWELRSKYAKISIGKKDVTFIDNRSATLRIFEGFFDYLSFLQIKKNKIEDQFDYLILNSTALLLKNIDMLEHYKTIELYLDNDSTGEKYTNIIKNKHTEAFDFRSMYKDSKDINEWLIANHLKLNQ